MNANLAQINTSAVYTGRELWTHLGKSESTFYRMLKDGLERYGSNHSGVWLFSGKNIERWVLGFDPLTVDEMKASDVEFQLLITALREHMRIMRSLSEVLGRIKKK